MGESKNQISDIQIEGRILSIRNMQVMVDKDLAELYGVETKVLNQAVKRNIERFPADFMFQLTKEECLKSQFATLNESNVHKSDNLKSQIVTSSWGGNRKLPYVFTEQGVAMLSGVLRSERAIEVNIRIMRAFVAMRRFLVNNAQVFQRLETIEYHQLEMQQHQKEADKRIDEIFQKFEEKEGTNQGIFFDGQVFDAYVFVSDLVKAAKTSIILIDNYIDETVLTMLDKRTSGIDATIYTAQISRQLQLDVDRHNAQYPPISINIFRQSHDRFMIIDNDVYHIGASIKDLGKKWFGFTLMKDITATEIINHINRVH